jgi:putative methyltransferase (TIGR04325 family)
LAAGGYDSHDILEKVTAAALKVKHGEAVYERDSVIFDKVQYSWPVIAALMHAASTSEGRLRVLDFGGALGSSYFESSGFTASLKELKWGVVEQPHFVARGRQVMENEHLKFFDSIEECAQAITPNLILISNSLQYVQDYTECLEKLVKLRVPHVVVDRTIVNFSESNRIYIQVVPKEIYDASYPVYSFSQQRLLGFWLSHRYRLVADFPSLDFPALQEIDSVFKGYLFSEVGCP